MTFEIITTRNCNLNCKYCFEGEKKDVFLSIDVIPEILDFIDSFLKNDFIYNKEYVRIDFNGGEALLNKKFIIEFMNKTKTKNFDYSITTNGLLLDEDLINIINDNKIKIQISLDGRKISHDLNRQYYNGEGSFDAVFEKAILLKKKYWESFFSVSLVFTPETVYDLADNIKFLLENEFYEISFSPCLDFEWKENDIKEFDKQMKQIGKIYIDYMMNEKEIYLSQLSDAFDIILNNFQKSHCGACTDMITILPNGNILPCGGFVGCTNENEISVGNISNDLDYEKINFYVFQKKLKANDQDCNLCVLNSRCHHICFAVNNRIMHDRLKICPIICRLNQLSIIEADYVFDYLVKNNNKTFKRMYHGYFEK